jgi:Plavaka transposase
LIHECLDFILGPLKAATKVGIMLSDPLGWHWFCFTPLAAYIVDTLESTLVTGAIGKTSSVTMVLYKQFRDNFRHEPCTASATIAQLLVVKAKADP